VLTTHVFDAPWKDNHRYEDNVHIREGPPVSWQQIGFAP
jgi:hypothetical protein